MIKVLNLLTLFILMCGGQLVTLYWGPTSNSILGAKWFVSFIDDCIHHKFEVCQIFVDFFRLVKNQFNKSIKRLQSDNGTEFVNLEFSKFLKDNGLVHELACVNTP
ncbi:hypothetical protein CR513_40622, partial [Mucuna pruriens]